MTRLRLSHLISVAVFVPLIGCATPSGSHEPVFRDRWQFAAALDQLQEGDTASRVLELLGRPDDVFDPRETHPGNHVDHVLWCYGCDGHGSFPTLGGVAINRDGRVDDVFGEGPCPLPRGLVSETDLRQILRLMHAGPSDDFGSPGDPLLMVTFVNHLIALGEEAAVAAMLEYDRVAPYWLDDGLCWAAFACYVAFEVPAATGRLPDGGFGAPACPPAGDPKLTPRFPMHVVEDTPYFLAIAYRIGSEVSYAQAIRDVADSAALRTTPLRPGPPGVAISALLAELRAIDAADHRTAGDAFAHDGYVHGHAETAWRVAGADYATLERVERTLIGQPQSGFAAAPLLRGLDEGDRALLSRIIADSKPWEWR